ncbi:MAG: YkgJ family cysteine cluster protein [Caldilineales bacterium]|nr:YkgJ family cysteine cluster protein [Caldilineales bacterium]
MTHPCLTCGACCAHYRVSFYWAEADDAGGTVPIALTERMDINRLSMRGTGSKPARCVALLGAVGEAVRCTIYESRPSVCAEFTPSWEDGQANPLCDNARAAWDLPSLEPGWREREEWTVAA